MKFGFKKAISSRGRLGNILPATSDLLVRYDLSDTFTADSQTFYTDLSGNGRHALKTNNLVTNGNCELDYGWDYFSNPPSVNERSSEQKVTGSYSRKVVYSASETQGIQSLRYSTNVGDVVNYSFYLRRASGTGTIRWVLYKGGSGVAASGTFSTTTAPYDEWIKFTGSYTEDSAGANGRFVFYLTAGSATFYVDDVSSSIDEVDLIALPVDSEISDNLVTPETYYDTGNPINVRLGDIEANENNQVFLNDKMLIYNRQLYGNDLVQAVNYVGYDIFETLTNIVTVGAGKDYATIPLALSAITDASADNMYRIDVYDDYTITDKADYTFDDGVYYRYVITKPYTFIKGIGAQKRVVCSIPETATDNETAFYEASIFNENMVGCKNMYFSMKNGRYAAHMDSIANNATMIFKDSYFDHNGNQEVIDYRITNSLPFSGVQAGTFGIGMGTSSGFKGYFDNCTVKGIRGMYIHNNSDFSIGHYIQFNKCNFLSSGVFNTNENPDSELLESMFIDSLTSGQENINEHNVCFLNSFITYTARVYDTGAVESVPYILADTFIIGADNALNGFVNEATDGGSLFIQSNSGGSISVTGGDAEPIIIPNSEVFNGGALGQAEVGYWTRNLDLQLGKRLGDCSSVNKTLSVLVDGTEAIDVVFNEDFTNQDNDYILGFINTALTTFATASLYQRAKDYVPEFI